MSATLPSQSVTIPVAANEAERLAALHRYQILDTPPEAGFDRITRLAARLFDMPIALISLLDESRVWFKSCIGFGANEVPRDVALCSFAVLTDEPLIVPDTRLDERFACNPLVQSKPGVRFYAGAPLRSHDGFNLGALCLLDYQPRPPLTSEQRATLIDLAAMVVDELELRLAAHQITQINAALRSITQGIATVTGGDFMDALVENLSNVLNVDYAYIGLVKGDQPKMLQTIATCAHGQIVENLEYRLHDTPCWDVMEQRTIGYYPRQVQTHFPDAPLLQALSVESYIAVPFFDSSGTPLGVLAVMDSEPLEAAHMAESLLTVFADRVATELKRQHVGQERQRFLAVASDLQVITKADGYFQWVSPSFERLLGWTVEEMLSRPWIDFVHPDDLNPSVAETDSLLFGNETLEFENRYRHKDGSYRWLLWNAHPYPQEQIIYGVAVDITERKQVEATLHEQATLLQLIVDSIGDGLIVANPKGEFVLVNQAAARFFGSLTNERSCEEWSQTYGLYLPDQQTFFPYQQLPLYRAMQGESVNDVEVFVRRQPTDDGRWVSVCGVPVRDPSGNITGGVITCRDVTERKLILQQEQAAREEAERANRVKDDFLAVLSHELRSPLNPILGWSKLLQLKKLDAAKTAIALETIERNARLQVQLIDDLLDISRILRGKLRLTMMPVDLNTVISAALETVRLAADAKAIQIQTQLSLDPVIVLGDAGRLQQVVWNLLSNAVKFTPTTGRVTVALSSTDRQAQIQVIDTGKGINPDFLPYVFERFRQEDGATNRKFGGLGLGLAIVRQMTELHGGTVAVDSPGEGQGATFTVQLPLSSHLNVLPMIKPSDNSTTNLNGIRILVVDDEADSREFVAFVLEQAGALVTPVPSAINALQTLSTATFDVIVSDIGMPEMNGYMLMQEIRNRPEGKHIPAIALTAYAGEPDQQQAVAAGFQKHFSKPFNPADIMKAIGELLHS